MHVLNSSQMLSRREQVTSRVPPTFKLVTNKDKLCCGGILLLRRRQQRHTPLSKLMTISVFNWKNECEWADGAGWGADRVETDRSAVASEVNWV